MSVIAGLGLVSAALILGGFGSAVWGHHVLEPDYAYAGVGLIFGGLICALIAAVGWLLFTVSP